MGRAVLSGRVSSRNPDCRRRRRRRRGWGRVLPEGRGLHVRSPAVSGTSRSSAGHKQRCSLSVPMPIPLDLYNIGRWRIPPAPHLQPVRQAPGSRLRPRAPYGGGCRQLRRGGVQPGVLRIASNATLLLWVVMLGCRRRLWADVNRRRRYEVASVPHGMLADGGGWHSVVFGRGST